MNWFEEWDQSDSWEVGDPQPVKASHTPGPWFAGVLSGDEGEEYVTVGPSEKDNHFEDSVCECWHGNHDAPANARLIAAAPELLNSCRELIKTMKANGLTVLNLQEDKHRDALIRAMIAVRKATRRKG